MNYECAIIGHSYETVYFGERGESIMKKRIVILSALMASTALLAVGCTRTNDKAGTNDSAVQTLLNKIDDTEKNDETETSEKNDMEQSTDEADKLDNKSGNSEIDAELAGIKAQSDEIDDKLTNDSSLTQGDMNQLSAQMYKLWDDELNSIWERLKDKLDDDTMSKLTEDERNWIADKEAKVKAAGADAEGGSFWRIVRQQS